MCKKKKKQFKQYMQKWYAPLWVPFKDFSSLDKILIAR